MNNYQKTKQNKKPPKLRINMFAVIDVKQYIHQKKKILSDLKYTHNLRNIFEQVITFQSIKTYKMI